MPSEVVYVRLQAVNSSGDFRSHFPAWWWCVDGIFTPGHSLCDNRLRCHFNGIPKKPGAIIHLGVKLLRHDQRTPSYAARAKFPYLIRGTVWNALLELTRGKLNSGQHFCWWVELER